MMCVLPLALLCRFGFDKWGYDKNGFDRAGFDFQGLNKEGQGRFAIYTPTKKTKCGTNASEVRAQWRKDVTQIWHVKASCAVLAMSLCVAADAWPRCPACWLFAGRGGVRCSVLTDLVGAAVRLHLFWCLRVSVVGNSVGLGHTLIVCPKRLLSQNGIPHCAEVARTQPSLQAHLAVPWSIGVASTDASTDSATIGTSSNIVWKKPAPNGRKPLLCCPIAGHRGLHAATKSF